MDKKKNVWQVIFSLQAKEIEEQLGEVLLSIVVSVLFMIVSSCHSL